MVDLDFGTIKDGIEAAKAYADCGVSVDHYLSLFYSKKLFNDLCLSYEHTSSVVGGSTASTYLAIYNNMYHDMVQQSDVIIMLGCEGNVDNKIKDYIDNL